jgi:RimJ/RimL family protein N-acetyltransferase
MGQSMSRGRKQKKSGGRTLMDKMPKMLSSGGNDIYKLSVRMLRPDAGSIKRVAHEIRVMDSNQMKNSALPLGEPVSLIAQVGIPRRGEYHGQYVTLTPLYPESDAHELYACSHGSEERERLWTYMPYGPFENISSMRKWLGECARSHDPLFFTVFDRRTGKRVGMVSFLNIVSEMRCLEVGHIWYSLTAQRTSINTEALYLMLCESFDRLQYRRVEWKCDSLNERSRNAAVRLGFKFEGIFRQHRIVKGRNRDTAWFSMIDSEWPLIKQNMERWLYANADGRLSLRELNANGVNP